MATTQTEEIQGYSPQEGLDIGQLVSGEPTWKDILLEMVRKEKLNPWDVDIVDVVDNYVAAVKKMKVLDLRIPANIMLAAAMLVRFKSEVLLYEQQRQDEIDAMEERLPRQNPSVEPLTVRLRLPPKRRLTLGELITALDEAMKLKEVKELAKKNMQVSFPLVYESVDIEEESESIYALIKGSVDRSNMTTFSAMMRARQFDDALLGLFIPLLFLAHKNRITLIQEKFFDEIIIALT